MGELRLPGLATGIDTSQLISQLMALEHRTLDRYETRRSEWNDRKNALSGIESKLQSLKAAVAALSDADELRAYATASSDPDILTADASYNAFEGNHTVIVNQLANAERWVHSAGKEYAEDYVGAGTFIYSYNHQETVITTTDDTTLEDLAGLINNDANNPGVTANLLYYNDAYHLVLNGNDAGSDYEVQINASNTEVWQGSSPLTADGEDAGLADRITSLDQFSGTLAGDEYITISGHLHDGTFVSQDVLINEHTTIGHLVSEIDDLFNGTATATLVNGQIRLTDHTGGVSQMDLSLTYHPGSGATTFDIPAISEFTEGGSVTASLAGFATADFTETQSAQDSQIKVDGYPTGESEWITRSSNTVFDVIQGMTLHLHDTGTIEVNLTRDIASVKEKLNAVVTAYNAAVAFIQEKTGYDKLLQTGGVLMGDAVVLSISSDLRLPLIERTSGFLADVDTFLTPAQIGLELDRDGMLSLNSSEFDEAIAKDYAGTLAIIGAAKTGSSDSNVVEFYGASERYTTAGSYDVEVTVAAGAITSARMKLSTETTYRDATISGNIITGVSTFDGHGNPVNPEHGLQLSVDLSQNGTFTATVNVKQGFAGDMVATLDRILEATYGSLQLDQEQVDDQIGRIDDQMDKEEARLSKVEDRLVAKFARLEKTLSMLQNQMAALGMS